MKTLGSCHCHPCFLITFIVTSKVRRSQAWNLEPREWGGIQFSINKVSDLGQITEHHASASLSVNGDTAVHTSWLSEHYGF